MDLSKRFLNKIKIDEYGCWIWQGSKSDKGYGFFRANGRTQLAHRYAYIAVKGPIAGRRQLDHTCHSAAVTIGECDGGPTCRHRACVNPDHLELVTSRTNVIRGVGPTAKNYQKNECPHGHPYDEENTQRTAKGARQCRECRRLQGIKRNAAKRKSPRDMTKCLKGLHEITLPNALIESPAGRKQCRECCNAAQRARYRAKTLPRDETKCRKGLHDITLSGALIPKTGGGMQCHECKKARQAAYDARRKGRG